MTGVFEQVLQDFDRTTAPPSPKAPKAFLRSFKPYLNSSLPFQAPSTQVWEPQIRQSSTHHIPLIHIQQLLTRLLTVVKGDQPTVTCSAVGLTASVCRDRLQHLTGVILNHPSGSSDAYRFTLREAVLEAGFVSQPDQIFFMDEVVAALLADCYQLTQTTPQSTKAPKPKLSGGHLVISAGASTTELLLVNQTRPAQQLTRKDLYLRRIAYAGNSLDQDIICHLLYPLARGWESLDLKSLNLPLPGEADLEARYRLQQRLESVPLGQRLLNSVRKIKPILCEQDVSFSSEGRQWTIRQQDLQNWVIAPYLQQVNREVNLLLGQLDFTNEQVQRVVCVGATATIPAIADWLRQKFPTATVVMGNELAAQGLGQHVASGLAVLPQFPSVLDSLRHQYSDYFLLKTLLQQLPHDANQLLSWQQLHAMLEPAGVNGNQSRTFLANLLEGRLPAGLVVTPASALLFAPTSTQTPEYQALSTVPLFTRQPNEQYQVNQQQRDRLWQQLQTILAHTHQTLDAPLSLKALTPQTSQPA